MTFGHTCDKVERWENPHTSCKKDCWVSFTLFFRKGSQEMHQGTCKRVRRLVAKTIPFLSTTWSIVNLYRSCLAHSIPDITIFWCALPIVQSVQLRRWLCDCCLLRRPRQEHCSERYFRFCWNEIFFSSFHNVLDFLLWIETQDLAKLNSKSAFVLSHNEKRSVKYFSSTTSRAVSCSQCQISHLLPLCVRKSTFSAFCCW